LKRAQHGVPANASGAKFFEQLDSLGGSHSWNLPQPGTVVTRERVGAGADRGCPQPQQQRIGCRLRSLPNAPPRADVLRLGTAVIRYRKTLTSRLLLLATVISASRVSA
jgi:hypothetical protein